MANLSISENGGQADSLKEEDADFFDALSGGGDGRYAITPHWLRQHDRLRHSSVRHEAWLVCSVSQLSNGTPRCRSCRSWACMGTQGLHSSVG